MQTTAFTAATAVAFGVLGPTIPGSSETQGSSRPAAGSKLVDTTAGQQPTVRAGLTVLFQEKSPKPNPYNQLISSALTSGAAEYTTLGKAHEPWDKIREQIAGKTGIPFENVSHAMTNITDRIVAGIGTMRGQDLNALPADKKYVTITPEASEVFAALGSIPLESLNDLKKQLPSNIYSIIKAFVFLNHAPEGEPDPAISRSNVLAAQLYFDTDAAISGQMGDFAKSTLGIISNPLDKKSIQSMVTFLNGSEATLQNVSAQKLLESLPSVDIPSSMPTMSSSTTDAAKTIKLDPTALEKAALADKSLQPTVLPNGLTTEWAAVTRDIPSQYPGPINMVSRTEQGLNQLAGLNINTQLTPDQSYFRLPATGDLLIQGFNALSLNPTIVNDLQKIQGLPKSVINTFQAFFVLNEATLNTPQVKIDKENKVAAVAYLGLSQVLEQNNLTASAAKVLGKYINNPSKVNYEDVLAFFGENAAAFTMPPPGTSAKIKMPNSNQVQLTLAAATESARPASVPQRVSSTIQEQAPVVVDAVAAAVFTPDTAKSYRQIVSTDTLSRDGQTQEPPAAVSEIKPEVRRVLSTDQQGSQSGNPSEGIVATDVDALVTSAVQSVENPVTRESHASVRPATYSSSGAIKNEAAEFTQLMVQKNLDKVKYFKGDKSKDKKKHNRFREWLKRFREFIKSKIGLNNPPKQLLVA